ncbi:hypothetical protein MAR_028990, partial [Mya arenaria]
MLVLPTSFPDKCHPNPCIHGSCFSDALGYVCVCDSSFTGKNCDSGTAKLTAAIKTQQTTLHMPTTPVSATVAPTL